MCKSFYTPNKCFSCIVSTNALKLIITFLNFTFKKMLLRSSKNKLYIYYHFYFSIYFEREGHLFCCMQCDKREHPKSH